MKGFENMDRVDRWWRRLLVGLLPMGLVLAACTSATGVSNSGVAAPEGERPVAMNLDKSGATSSDALVANLTINVDVTDEGFEPQTIFIPAGRRVQLIVRNRGTAEHHYRVLGLAPRELLWRAGPEGAREEGVTDEDHEIHHSTDFMPWRAKSAAGIRPMGDEVHAYAEGGGMDVVLFTATAAGTFSVKCPLHPEITGKVSVF